MDDNAKVERVERKRETLLQEAGSIFQAAEKEGRSVGDEEDARVLALMA